MSAAAIPTFCRLPAERLRMSVGVERSSSPTRLWSCSMCELISPVGIPSIRAMKSKYSFGLRKSMRNPSSMKAPVHSFHSSDNLGLTPCSVAAPWSGRERSRSKRRRVVLPAPLFPTSPTRSPFSIFSSGMSTAVTFPNVFLILSISIAVIGSRYLMLRP